MLSIIFIVSFCIFLVYLILKNNINLGNTKINQTQIQDQDQILNNKIDDPDLGLFINKQLEIINNTKSLDVINKRFNLIKKWIQESLTESKMSIDIFQDVDISTIEKIEKLKLDYMKKFILNRVDMEMNKNKYIDSQIIKERQINKSLSLLLKVIEFLPDDKDIYYKIIELEQQLKENYE